VRIYKISIYTAIFLICESIKFSPHGIKFNSYIPVTSFFCTFKEKMLYKVRNTADFIILISGAGRKPETKRY